jgi:hypothetical protein
VIWEQGRAPRRIVFACEGPAFCLIVFVCENQLLYGAVWGN